MIAGIINICGAFSGRVDKMYENIAIRQGVLKPYLNKIGADINGQFPLPATNQLEAIVGWDNIINTIILKQGGNENTEWFYKDFRMVLTYPIWQAAFPESKWIIVRRKDKDIVDSCMKTSYMDAFTYSDVKEKIGVQTTEQGWQWWVDRFKKRFEEMKAVDILIMEVYPDKMVEGDFSEIKQVVEWLGLEWKEKEVKEFIQPKLWKGNN
jgi:hypothetical protein